MIANISLWWEGMSVLEKIYWSIALPFSVLFIIQTILTFIVGDGVAAEGDADVAIDSDTGIDFQFLSIKNLIAFFTIFGWVGVVTHGSGIAPVWSVVLATAAGLVMMTIMATLMYFMGKLTESGTLNLRKAIGKVATVYLTIPAKRNGMGKVQITVQGFQTLDAITDDEQEIGNGMLVEVIEVLNNEILIVKKS
jgi:membrane protein implicated in regulation of membrane protease activity